MCLPCPRDSHFLGLLRARAPRAAPRGYSCVHMSVEWCFSAEDRSLTKTGDPRNCGPGTEPLTTLLALQHTFFTMLTLVFLVTPLTPLRPQIFSLVLSSPGLLLPSPTAWSPGHSFACSVSPLAPHFHLFMSFSRSWRVLEMCVCTFVCICVCISVPLPSAPYKRMPCLSTF